MCDRNSGSVMMMWFLRTTCECVRLILTQAGIENPERQVTQIGSWMVYRSVSNDSILGNMDV